MRDGGRPAGELSPEVGDVLVVTVDVVLAALFDVMVATVPRSSLANCSLALGFDADAPPPLPLVAAPIPLLAAVGSSDTPGPSSGSAGDDEETVR